MNVIDEFFEFQTWDEALPHLVARNSELTGQDALTSAERLTKAIEHSQAAMQVMRRYLDFFQMNVRRDGRAAMGFLQTYPPKLTRTELIGLASVEDLVSARRFRAEYPKAWHALLVQQWIHGETFWQLLLASAELVAKGDVSRAPEFAKTTVVIGEGGERRRVFKLLPLSDGGFAVTAPYHKARAGSLMKVPVARQTGSIKIKVEDTVPFNASDRVKLSYHADGFVQFSGENNSRILSGRDRETGEPRGLGLISHPFSFPVQSGPPVGCSVWGLAEFEPWVERSAERSVVFEEDDDFYTEPQDEEDMRGGVESSGYNVSMFMLPPHLVEAAVGSYKTSDTILLMLPMNVYHRTKLFRVKLVRISPQCTLGIIVLKQNYRLGESGFQLGSPGDGKHTMIAIYPAIPVAEPGRNLDYQT